MYNYYSLDSFSIIYIVQKAKYQILLYSNGNTDSKLQSFPDLISLASIMKIPEGYFLMNNENHAITIVKHVMKDQQIKVRIVYLVRIIKKN